MTRAKFLSEEHKRHLSESLRGRPNPRKGQKRPRDAGEKTSIGLLKAYKENPSLREAKRAIFVKNWSDPSIAVKLRAGGVKARKDEKSAIDTLRHKFTFLEASNQVCDAIGLKDGKIILLEFKFNNKPKLKPIQAQAQKLLGDSYIVLVREFHSLYPPGYSRFPSNDSL